MIKMPSFCAVSSCELKYSHSENVSFHKFPLKNPKILAEWIKFTNRGINWKPSRWNSICSRHFDKSDFREYLSRKCLKKEAIPSIVPKSNISYETYHISSGSPEYTRADCNQLEQDEYEVPVENADDNKATTEAIENCRLCGERADNLTCNPLKSLDDPEVDLLCRKCLPSVNLNGMVEHSQIVCSDCIAQLKQYSNFIDKVLTYQREVDLNENIDSYAPSENSLHNGSRNQSDFKISTPNPIAPLFIKQEPINVKQEIIENTNRKPFTTQIPTTSPSIGLNPFAESKKLKTLVQQDFSLPKTELGSTYCGECDRIFANNFEFRSHKCTNTEQIADREQGNNCEVMEVITLNNPVSYIDLAEDENPTNVEQRKPKPEGLYEFEQRERLEFEHAYAKRASSTSCNLKQEITDSYNESSENGFDYNDYMNENDEFGQSMYFNESPPIQFDCPKCSQTFASQQLLDEHSYDSHPLKHKICSICNAEFKTSYDYLIHKTKTHTQRFQCKLCKQKFNKQTILQIHERICIRTSQDYCLSCRHCGKSIRNLIIMKKHLKNCNGRGINSENRQKNTKDISNRDVMKLKNLMDQNESHQSQNIPMPVTETIVNAQNLLNIGDSSGEKQGFKFIVDDSKFIFFNESKSEQNSDGSILNGRFACDTCGKRFSSFVHLKQHKMEHDSERKFSCSLCPKTFKGISGLKQHISGFHYKIKPYTCPVCNYAYALKGDMQRCRHSKLKNQTSFKVFL